MVKTPNDKTNPQSHSRANEFSIWVKRTFGTADENYATKARTVGGYFRTIILAIVYFAFAGFVTGLSFITYFTLYPIFGIATAQGSVDAITEWFFVYQAYMFENYVGCKVNYYGDFIPLRESAFVIGNHQWILDWALLFCLAVRKGMAGACKFFAKKSVLYIPFIGLGLWIMHGVFLDRNWDRDQRSIQKAFARQRRLKGHPVWMTTWPESTRITPEKLAESQQYAEKIGLPKWQYVLVPRWKGFVAQIHGLRDVVPVVYDITVAYGGPNHEPPTPMDMGCGGYGRDIHIYCKRFLMKDLPQDDEGIKKWLFDRWQEKDELLTYFNKHEKFPGNPKDEPWRYIPVWKAVPPKKEL